MKENAGRWLAVAILGACQIIGLAYAQNAPERVRKSQPVSPALNDSRMAEIRREFPNHVVVNAGPVDSPERLVEIRTKGHRPSLALVPSNPAAPISYATKGEVIVTLKPRVGLPQLKAFLRANDMGYRVTRQISKRGVYLLRSDSTAGANSWAAVTALSVQEMFVSVEVNQALSLFGNQHGLVIPTEQWSLDTVGLGRDGDVDADVDGLEALSKLKSSKPLPDVVVAVIDSGVSIHHPALKNRFWTNTHEVASNGKDDDSNGKVDDIHGWNFVDDSADLSDNSSHGTHVAGIIAADQHAPGVAVGLAPNARLMILKVTDGGGTLASLVQALDYAVENGAKVINMSLGSRFSSPALTAAVDNAANADIFVVAAAGNAEKGKLPMDISLEGNAIFPCLLNVSFCVTATDQVGHIASFSNYSSQPWVVPVFAAPGSNIWSTTSASTSKGYGEMSGTSMAAPHVAAVAAVVRGIFPEMDRYEVRRQIFHASDSGSRLNFYRAISSTRTPDENDPESYCNSSVENTPRKWIVPFANSYEPAYDGSSDLRAHTICSIQQLFALNTRLSKHEYFALMQDLDWNDINEPMRDRIGRTGPFQGLFNGLGHTLNNYTYSIALDDVGLFVRLGPVGQISNFRMTNVRLDGRNNIGALVGINQGVIENVQVEGAVNGLRNVGGIAGITERAVGATLSSGRLTNTFFEGRVNGSSTVGGIVGLALNDATIDRSFAKGFVTATGTDKAPAGGMIGEAGWRVEISASLAIVKVIAADTAGGLVGLLRCRASVRDSYTEGSASGRIAGGLVGVIENALLQDSYSLALGMGGYLTGGLIAVSQDNSTAPAPGTFACTQTAERLPPSEVIRSFYVDASNSPGAGGIPKRLIELRLASTFTGWSFGTSTWDLRPGETPSLVKLPRTRTSEY